MAEVERKILVAVDEGEESIHALKWCLKNVVCGNYKDTLVLLYAKQPRPVYSAMDGSGRTDYLSEGYLFSTEILAAMDKYTNEVADAVIEKAKRICREVHHDVKIDVRVENGDARDVICQMVDKLNVDMVVLGSHGYGLIKRTFLGSVSNHCAQNAKCPVLIVKMPKSASTRQ